MSLRRAVKYFKKIIIIYFSFYQTVAFMSISSIRNTPQSSQQMPFTIDKDNNWKIENNKNL